MTSRGKNASRVLIVDDFAVMRRTMIHLLEAGLGGALEFVEAGNGIEALAEFQPSEFALVIADWKMPKMNGLDMVKNVRSVDSAVPILMITTESQKERIVEALGAGVTDYLIKPFKQQMFVEKCKKYLPASVVEKA